MELRLIEHAFPDLKPGTLKCVSWDEVGARVTIPNWRKFVMEYASFLQGVTAESLPAQVPNFRQVGDRMRNPKGMLLDPQQRTRRAGQLFGVGLALTLIDHGWTLQVSPGVFKLVNASTSLNPFEIIDQLMAGKLSAQQWTEQCRTLGISKYLLWAPPPQPQPVEMVKPEIRA
jgi:hypothetical protein